MRKISKNQGLIFVTTSAILATSCGPIKDMEEMKKTTAEMKTTTVEMNNNMKQMMAITSDMNNTTKQLNKTSTKMNKTTNGINKNAAYTYHDMRLDTSVSNGFKALNEMEQAKSIEQKAIAAAYYMASFEFQLWKNDEYDSDELRDAMYALSLKRLFADLKEYITDINADVEKIPSDKVTDESREYNNLKNLYAISAVLHEVNPNQEALSEKNDIPITHVLELITNGLKSLRAGTIADAPEYQKIVAQNEELAVMLLRMRFNILAAKTFSLIQPAGLASIGKAILLGSPWEANLQNLSNPAKFEYASKVSKLAIDTCMRLSTNKYSLANAGIMIPLLPSTLPIQPVFSALKTHNLKSLKDNSEALELAKYLEGLKGCFGSK